MNLSAPRRLVDSTLAIRDRLPDRLFVGLLLVTLTYLTLRPARSPFDPALIVALFAIAFYRRPSMIRAVDRHAMVPFAALAVLLTVTTAIHHDPKGFNFLLQLVVLGGAAICWGASLRTVEVEVVRRWIVTLAVAGTIYAIFEALLRFPPVWGPQVNMNTWGLPISMANPILGNEVDRAQFTMGHPLLLAVLLVTAVMLVFRSRWPMTVRATLLSVLLVGMIFCGSRSIFPVAFVLLVAALVLDRRKVSPAAIIGAGTALVVAAALVAATPLWREFVISGSFTHRVGALEAAQHLFTRQGAWDLLFGNGVRSEPRLLEAGLLQSDKFPAVDNQFVQMLAIGGIVGLLLLLAVLAVAVWRSPKALRLPLIAIISMFLAMEILMWSFSVFLLFLFVGMCSRGVDRPESAQPLEGERASQHLQRSSTTTSLTGS